MKTTKYGNYSADGKEFILTEPLLNRPWMNILTNGNWCFVASHIGGGYSYVGQPSVGRITRWHIDGVPRDTVGKFIFLRDEETGEWWNANGYPPTKKLQSWRCHIGLGYNKIVSENLGIASEITYFTPMPDASKAGTFEVGDACLIWTIKLTNKSGRCRRISSTSYAELAPGNWYEDTSWREFYTLMQRQQYMDNTIWHRATTWVKETDGWQAQDSDSNNSEFPYSIFLNSSHPVDSFTGERYSFLGSYRDLTNPAAMDTPTLNNAAAVGRDSCLSMRNGFTLEPDESVEYVLVLGAEKSSDKSASHMYEKYNSPAKAQVAFDNLKKYWSNIISSPWVETPDPDLNVLINIWFKYQGAILSWWNRNTGYCYSGIYDFGIRDACQDAVSRLPHHPDWVRDFIKNKIMIWQFDNGDYAHSGNFMNMHAARTFHSDDPLNPLYIIASYCNETNDFSILHEKTAWVDPVTCIAGKSKKLPSPIYEHAVAGVEWFWKMFSERGLPLILKGDWNDALNQCGQAPKIDSQGRVLEDQKLCSESVLLAGWAVMCIEMFYPCMEYMKDFSRLEKYKKRIEDLKAKVNELCWDGNWYWRASDKTGRIIGTSQQLKQGGAIWSNPNAFAIITGIADERRTSEILKSFETYLDTPYGSLLFYPPFYEPDERVGIISRFAPGTKENGSVFCHASRWRIWAECVAGRGDKAYEILRQTLPTTLHESLPDRYFIEPYVACQFIYAPETDNPGEGSHSWATGTACWTLTNVFQHMLGITPQPDGLRIDPCLPKSWSSVKIARKFRGDTFEILINKEVGICKGKVIIELNGNVLDDNIICGRGDGSCHKVIVTVSSCSKIAVKQKMLKEQAV